MRKIAWPLMLILVSAPVVAQPLEQLYGKKKAAGTAGEEKKKEPPAKLTREHLEKVFKKHTPELRSCYERYLLKGVKQAWKLGMRLKVKGSGAVEEVKSLSFSGVPQNKEMLECLRKKVAGWRFPATKLPFTEVTYTGTVKSKTVMVPRESRGEEKKKEGPAQEKEEK